MAWRGRWAREVTMVGALLLAALVLGPVLLPSAAAALMPEDILIVYNLNLPESQDVARYYAEKRLVPSANLVGVNVPATENLSRDDYEIVLAEPLRRQAQNFLNQGRQPAILLVYGIPLRVDDPLFSRWVNLDQDFLNLAQGKVQELTELCWRLNTQLLSLLGDKTAPGSETPPPAEVSRRTRETVAQAVAFPQKKTGRPGFDAGRHAIFSQIIKLAGSEPEFEAFKQQVQGRSLGGAPPLPPPQLQQFAILKTGQEEAAFRGILPETALELAPSIRHTNGLVGELQFWQRAAQICDNPQTKAAEDSELTMLLAEPYQKAQWLPNPFLARFDQLPFIAGLRQTNLMVGRLDGPTPEIAKRLVDDAQAAEASGLNGSLYIDARGLSDTSDVYPQFDERLRQLHDLIRSRTTIPVVLDNRPELFAAGSRLPAALYVGWYSLANYVDAFVWERGAVAYHVASAEAMTLRHRSANVWCKRLLEQGVAATLGPVAEPYLHSFPRARRVLPPAPQRSPAPLGGLLSHHPPGILAADPHRRSPVQSFPGPAAV